MVGGLQGGGNLGFQDAGYQDKPEQNIRKRLLWAARSVQGCMGESGF